MREYLRLARVPDDDETTRLWHLVEAMPQARVRINPDAIRELVAWLAAYRAESDAEARMCVRELTGRARVKQVGQREAARAHQASIDRLIGALYRAVMARPYYAALDAWDDHLARLQAEG